MKKFETGLIVGKFSPLHKGHEYLITSALSMCEHLTIITYSNPEFNGCSAPRRASWLKAMFPQTSIHALNSNLPDNDGSDYVHRRFVGEFCRDRLRIFPKVVFTSESYGLGFADYLTNFFGAKVEHVCIDIDRKHIPISGSKIRSDIHACRVYLSPIVYADFVETICFLGAESSGKSTLTQSAAELFKTVAVSKYGRTLWEQKAGNLAFRDMIKIAKTHVSHEEKQRLNANRFLFVDTSPLTTLFYSECLFSRATTELKRLSQREYDHVFLCDIDFPLVQDGTRSSEEFRCKQQEWYLKTLKERNIRYHVLSGNLSQRLKSVQEILLAKG